MEARSRNGLHDLNLASRKTEESALRRYQAAEWLECLVGPLGIPNQPSEREFISSLRNGLILCNAINKINPGAVARVVDNQVPLQTLNRESQPLPAYQYFENVRNFLVAVEELKLPAFEASNLERDAQEAGSAARVADCILALKSYQESKQIGGVNGINNHIKSPLVLQSANKMLSRAVAEVQPSPEGGLEESAELIAKQLADYMVEAKENLKGHLAASVRNRYQDPMVLFSWILSNCVGEELQEKFPELLSLLKDLPNERNSSPSHPKSAPGSFEQFRACVSKGNRSPRHLSHMHEKEIMDLKDLLAKTKKEFEELQRHIQKDLNDLGRQVQELSGVTLGYHKVVKENRNLYNMVQDLKGNIRVYCRIRPSFSTESKNVVDSIGEDGSLVILDPLKSQKDRRKVFKFNQVYGPTASQDTVFMDTQPLIRSVMDGYNVCIFAYGQTGSGKTFTMSGPSSGSSKDMGINYLALNDLFHLSNQRKDTVKYDIFVQMIEIYNEQVRDLLAEEASNKLEIRSCNDSGMNLPDATLHSVKSTTDVLNLMKLGEVNRAVSSTAMNNRSSRSHSVLTVHVHGKDFSGNTLRSRLHLVDLAGSERVDKSEVTGERLKEAQYINKSLSCLGDVIAALAQKNSHIPYRNSKLTLLLQDSLGGHAKTLMLAHVSPEEDSFSETLSTLKFAQRVSTVELGAARLNRESGEVMQLREQVESLRKELAKKEAQKTLLLNREPPTPTEKAPLPLRRLSNGNSSTTRTDKSKNTETRSATKSPSLQPRRRLSQDGSKRIKKSSSLPNVSADEGTNSQFEPVPMPQYCPDEDAEAVSKPYDPISSCNSDNSEIELHAKAPQSPTSVTSRKRHSEVGIGTGIPPLNPPQTPETSVLSSHDILRVDSRTPNSISRTDEEVSQIRKSIRRSGKLITGPEKRRQQNTVEEKSSMQTTNIVDDGKSSSTASTRTRRRKSIIGVPSSSSAPDKPRRSSLGAKPTISSNEKDSYERTPIRSAPKPPSRRWV